MAMNIEEAKKMQGVEFTYIFEDGDTIQAYVKKFDPEVGLTCLSLATETKQGWAPTKGVEDDGTFCVVGVRADDLPRCFYVLEYIKEKGSWINDESPPLLGQFVGCVFS